MVNLCHYTYELYNNTAFYKEIQPKEVDMQNFLNACIYTSSSGLITDYLTGSSKTAFDELVVVYDGMDGYKTEKATYQDVSPALTKPAKMTTYETSLADAKSFKSDDYTKVAEADRPVTVLNTLNGKVSCTNDKWVFYTGGTNCSGYTIWQTSDGPTGGLSGKYCIAVQTYKGASYTGTQRYTSGNCANAEASNIDTLLANLYTFYGQANTLYTNMGNTLTAGSGASK